MDGELSDEEMEKIAEYAAQNFGSASVEVKSISKIVIEAAGDEVLKHMLVAAAYIGANVAVESKIKMLDFLIELAKADGNIHSNELHIIKQLKEAWL